MTMTNGKIIAPIAVIMAITMTITITIAITRSIGMERQQKLISMTII